MNELTIEQPLKEYPELLPFYEQMFYDRNIKMSQKIEGFLKSDKVHFVVVGAGHMVGDKGIVSLLKNAKKYKIKQF